MGAALDFLLAFSPEREDPGNKRSRIHEIPKVIGGLNPLSLQPALDVENDPLVLAVLLHRPYQQILRNLVEEALDVQIHDPVIAPASLSRLPHRIPRRLPRPGRCAADVRHPTVTQC